MSIVIELDFETKSRVDLKACGTDIYAGDPSTDILCCSFINKDNGQEWLWYAGDKIPADLILALQLAVEIEAHNARFDQLIYEYIAVEDYGFPALDRDVWICTAAQCRVNALPANLDGATRAANAKHKKDHNGTRLIRKLSVPQKDGEFHSTPKDLADMGKYCLQDSRAMRALTQTLRPMAEQDKKDWRVNERINDRGVLIDAELATLAQQYAADEKAELGRKLAACTTGAITAVTQTARMLTLIREHYDDNADIMDCITKAETDDNGEPKYTLDKAARGLLLELPDLPERLREAIGYIDDGSSSSVAKFTSMLNRADPETGRVCGAFIFAGAGQTQRYSSAGLQLHNMRRDCFKPDQTEEILAKMRCGEKLPDTMNTLARLLRPAIIPAPGHTFVVGDWSAIEARVLPWLTNTAGGEQVLDVFRKGEDIYLITAAAMRIDERQIGKVATLSLGYGGGVGAFQAMAKNYGLTLDDVFVQGVVDRWRAANPWAKRFWKQLERATVAAVRDPKTVYTAGRVRYVFVPELLGGTLLCILPNGSAIQYPYARIEEGLVTAMKASVRPKADSDDEWPRMDLWGGFLSENITQATAACLLREALEYCVDNALPVIAHVHDEIILEAVDCEVDEMVGVLQDAMEFVPEWAKGLPLKAEPVTMAKYGK